MTDTPAFVVPPNDQPLTPTRVRALGDTLKVHHQTRRGGIEPDAVATLVERLAVEVENRDRAHAAAVAAKKRADEALAQWRTEHTGDSIRPADSAVHMAMEAQWQVEADLARANAEIAHLRAGAFLDTGSVPPRPDTAERLADNVLATVRWLTAALPAAQERLDQLTAAKLTAEETVIELQAERDSLAEVLPIAGAELAGKVMLEVAEAS